MRVSAELAASFLAGLVDVEGFGCYLLDEWESNLVLQAFLHYDITTVHEKLNFISNDMKESMSLTQIDGNIVIHIVAEIIWGAQNIVTAKRVLSQKDDRTQVEGQLAAEFEKLKLIEIAREGA